MLGSSDLILCISEAGIQGEAAGYFIYRTMLELGLQVVYSMFLGDWIEKQGCKVTMILPLFGFLLSSLFLLLLAQIPPFPLPIILLASLPVGLSGGNLAFSISTFSYVTRITTNENRSFRIAMTEGSAIVGIPIGLLVGSEVSSFISVP
jgi:MFS family permease